MGPYFISSFINLLLAIDGRAYAKALVYEKRPLVQNSLKIIETFKETERGRHGPLDTALPIF